MRDSTMTKERFERFVCSSVWQETDPCRDRDLRRHVPQRVTRDLLQDMKISVLTQELSQVRKLVEMLLCLVDPEDVKAALEMRDLTPREADWSAMAAASEPPPELRGVQEGKPW